MVMFIGKNQIGYYTLRIIRDNETLTLLAPNLAQIKLMSQWFHIRHISIEFTLSEEDKRIIRGLFSW